jgi:CheY-like chemotaxis protein
MEDKKILIVDDEEPIRKLFTTALTQKGYRVFTAESGEKALELLKNEPIPVMFLDLNLPGINGVDLCKIISRQAPDTVAYAITGYAADYTPSECKAAGFTDFFSKPISIHQLYEAADMAFQQQFIHQ